MKKVVLLIIYFSVITACSNQNSEREKTNILSKINSELIQQYKYKEAIKSLIEFDSKNPGYSLFEVNVAGMLAECYLATNDFHNFELTINTLQKTNNDIASMKLLTGIDAYQGLYQRYYVKYNQVKNAMSLILDGLSYDPNQLKKLPSGFRNDIITYHFDTLVDYLALNMYAYAEANELASTQTKNELNTEYIKPLFYDLLNLNSKRITIKVFSDLINYRNITGSYIIDPIWTWDSMINTIKALKDKGLLAYEDLNIIRGNIFRLSFPDGLEETLNNIFNSRP